jgi:hypothetical protein
VQNSTRFIFWWRWLIVVTLGVMLFGIVMVALPALTLEFFGLLLYSSPETLSTFGAPTIAYITLVHGVLGSVMFGWGVALLYILLGPFRRGSREGWLMLVVSLAAWFVPDTALSLWSGFWQNAALNGVIAVLYTIPLVASYRAFKEQDL